LFNDTIYYNILYGRLGASQEDIFQAAQQAAVHDQILAMPDGSVIPCAWHCVPCLTEQPTLTLCNCCLSHLIRMMHVVTCMSAPQSNVLHLHHTDHANNFF